MNIYFMILFTIFSTNIVPTAFSQQNSKSTQNNSDQPLPNSSSAIEFEVKKEDSNNTPKDFFPDVEQLFENPRVLSGLQNTAEAINRSVETLMESIFYSLLDRKFQYPTSPHISVNAHTERNVFNTANGAYVVVDRIDYGPSFRTPIGEFRNVPIFLGSYTQVDILDIYLRSDGIRLAESRDISKFTSWINNWFSMLPLVSRIMPPSFNPNQMYNPLNIIKTPFVFPLDIERVKAMPLGSVRSYSVSGGISLPFDLDFLAPIFKTEVLEKFDLNKSFPLTLSLQGEHRINVLKKSKNVIWVGLSKIKKMGGSLVGIIGNTLFILGGSIQGLPWTWKGISTSFFPLDVDFTYENIFSNNILYEFSINTKIGRRAYLEAVKGNFVPAKLASTKKKRKSEKKSVTYHFNKKTHALVDEKKFSNSYFALTLEKKYESNESEIEINDTQGNFYILESSTTKKDKNWDILIGMEDISIKSTIVMNVSKTNGTRSKKRYKFNKKDPFSLDFILQIKDGFTDIPEYESYLNLIRIFTMLPIKGAPNLDTYSADKINTYRRKKYFNNPLDISESLHVTPTVLGKLHANASIHIPYKSIVDILKKDELSHWKAFCLAFGINEEKAVNLFHASLIDWSAIYFKKFAVSPLKLWNINIPSLDYAHEIRTHVNKLQKLNPKEAPLKLLRKFTDFLKSEYPENITNALLSLTDMTQVSRRAKFFVKPNPHLSTINKSLIKKLNAQTFQSASKFPKKKRYRIAKDKLTAFFPSHLNEVRKRPRLIHISINKSSKAQNEPNSPIVVNLEISDIRRSKGVHFYIKLETLGKIQIGNYLLGEIVTTLDPIRPQNLKLAKKGHNFYRFLLSGSSSPLHNFLYDQMLNLGGDYILSIAVSEDEEVWSQEKTFRFHYESGHISPYPG